MRQATALVLAALTILSVAVAPVLAANTGPGAINEDADAAHNPYLEADVTKATHEMGWGPMAYEDDQGDKTTLPAELNSSVENPYSLTYSDIETDAYGEFPVNTQTEDVDSALNATGWTTDGSGTAGSVSVADATTAPDVEAVQVSTSGQTSSDTAKATFDGFKVTSDAEKRYVQIVADVSTLDSGADVFIRFKDTDGDYVEAEIDPDDDSSTGNTMANTTGDGFVFQQQVGELTVSGTGDGTMQNINATTVVVNDANAQIEIAALNVERTSPWTLGKERVDSDGDGDLETETIRQVNASGDVSITSLDSMGTVFDSATIHDLTVPVKAYSSMMPEEEDYERWNVTYEEADDYPNFAFMVDDNRRLALPTAYDLSYANVQLKDTVPVPDGRYQVAEYATGVGETNFSDVTWTDAKSSYSPQDSNVTLATGLSAGTEYALHYEYVVTQDEYDAMTTATGGGAPMGDSGGGIGSIPIIGGIILTILGWLGLRG